MASPITSIYIENFQSHRKTKVQLADPGRLTVIVGPSDCGKTAIIRALRWLLYNIPQGTDHIRVGTTTATVAISLADGTMVVRERGRSFNRYRIVSRGGTEQIFEGFGNAVPLEVQEVTGVRPVTIGDLELTLNLAEQLDGPFLGKSVSGGARAKVLGKLAGTEEVDHAARTLGTDLYRASQDEKRLACDIEELRQKVEEYAYLPELEKRIAALETIRDRVSAMTSKRAHLVKLNESLTQIRQRAAEAERIISSWARLEIIEPAMEVAEIALRKAQRLQVLFEKQNRINAEMEAARHSIERWSGLEAAQDAAARANKQLSSLGKVIALNRKLSQVEGAIGLARAALRRWSAVQEAEETINSAARVVERGRALVTIRHRLARTQQAIIRAEGDLNRWTGLLRAEELVKSSEDILARRRHLKDKVIKLDEVRKERLIAENRVSELTGMLSDAQSQYIDLLAQAGRCPTCGSSVDPERLKEVIGS